MGATEAAGAAGVSARLKTARRAVFLLPGPYVYEDRCQTYIGRGSLFGYREPVEEMYAAAVLEASGVSCSVVHAAPMGLGLGEAVKRALSVGPDVVIISATYPGHNEDLAAAEMIRERSPGVLILARGGHFAHVDRKRVLSRFPALDAVLGGDAGAALQKMSDAGGEARVPGVALRRDGVIIDDPPDSSSGFEIPAIPARHLLDHGLYRSPGGSGPMATVTASRGCHIGCTFCPAPAVSGAGVRVRDAESVVDEVLRCRRDHGIGNFFMRGDNFAHPRDWVLGLSKALSKRAHGIRWVCSSRADSLDGEVVSMMKRSGCWGVSIGAESASEGTLERIGKRLSPGTVEAAVGECRRAGVMSMAYFMIGFPWEGRRDIVETIKFAGRLRADVAEYFFPYPFPGTPLYAEAAARGLVDDDNPPKLSQQEPVFIPAGMSRLELAALRTAARLGLRRNLRAACALLGVALRNGDVAGTLGTGLKTFGRAV
jgi:tRNA A37 methylthiotransferase MiaB